jgi:hypothetical protein
MFRFHDILGRRNERPFTPFRITTSSGQIYEVRHPELVFANRNFVFVGVPLKDSSPGAIHDFIKVAMLHITAMDPCGEPQPAGDSNGIPTSV